MKIIELTEAVEKVKVVANILADLPEWFGLPESTAAYVEASRELTCFVAVLADEYVGFVTLEQRFNRTAEINAMGVLAKHHRQGLGEALMLEVLAWCQRQEIQFLQVKTLAASHPDPYYQKTRLFYQQQGFSELEVFPTLWGPDNPCLQLIMAVNTED